MSKSPADIAALLTDEPPQPVDGVIRTCLMSSPILGGSDDNRLRWSPGTTSPRTPDAWEIGHRPKV